jgi:hypothetical protein
MSNTRDQLIRIAKNDPKLTLVNLDELLLQHGFLTELADLLMNNTHVKGISLRCSGFHSLAPLACLRSLEFLDLTLTPTNNDMLESITSLSNLKVLKLNGTKVTSLASIPAFKSLCELDLYSLAIDDLSPLSSLSGLKKITLFQYNGHRNVNLTPLSCLTDLVEIHLDPLNENYLVDPTQKSLFHAILQRNLELAKDSSISGKIKIFNHYLEKITACNPIIPTLEDSCLSVLKSLAVQPEAHQIPPHLVTKYGSFKFCNLVDIQLKEVLGNDNKKLKF